MTTNAQSVERRTEIIEAASSAFLRYGFRKTSMDDVARIASLSRQGLYLHFSNKDSLFIAVVENLVQETLNVVRSALSDAGVSFEDRLHNAFLAMYEIGHRHGGPVHFDELLVTASRLAPEVLQRHGIELTDSFARVLKSSGVVDRWQSLHLTPHALAENLLATSNGLKHLGLDTVTYNQRMRVAVSIICRDVSSLHKNPSRKKKL